MQSHGQRVTLGEWLRHLLVVLVLLVGISATWVTANMGQTFRQASATAPAVVLLRYIRSDLNMHYFGLVETLKGAVVKREVPISRLAWRFDFLPSPDSSPSGTLYLVLLNGTGGPLCRQNGDAIIIGDTCFGVLPIIKGRLPAEYRSYYDGSKLRNSIAIEQIRQELVSKKRRAVRPAGYRGRYTH